MIPASQLFTFRYILQMTLGVYILLSFGVVSSNVYAATAGCDIRALKREIEQLEGQLAVLQATFNVQAAQCNSDHNSYVNCANECGNQLTCVDANCSDEYETAQDTCHDAAETNQDIENLQNELEDLKDRLADCIGDKILGTLGAIGGALLK